MTDRIDWGQKKSAADVVATVLAARRDAVNAECERRIFAVASANTQRNIVAELATIAFKPEAERTNQDATIMAGGIDGLAWIKSMRAAAAVLRENGSDYTLDSMWPDVPASVGLMLDLI